MIHVSNTSDRFTLRNAEQGLSRMSTVKSPRFHVFISHSSEDRTWADAACEVLERRKMRCWIAPRDISPGTEWGAAIVDGIDRSRVMVLIFSANANQSPQVRREVERAIAKSVPILPLRIEDIRPQGAMEFALSNTHWLDAFAAPADERLAQLADSVMALLGVKREKKSATQSVPLMPVVRKRKMPWIVAMVLTAIVVLGILFMMMPDDDASPSLVNPTGVSNIDTSAAPAVSVEDETSSFQGRWFAVEETAAGHGPFSDVDVASRKFILVIQGHHLEHSVVPVDAGRISLTGDICFEKTGDKRTFSVQGIDGDGIRRKWKGPYKFEENFLYISYRLSEGRGIEPTPPMMFQNNGERGIFYAKLRRAGAKRNKRQ